jgi:uncharacterized membrane protein
MELDGHLFSVFSLWLTGLMSLALFMLAAWIAPWWRLADREQLHVFLGSCVALMVMWTLRTSVYEGIQFHLLFLTTLTLMFGWSLGVMAGTLVLAGITIGGFASLQGFALNMLTVVLLPVTFTQVSLVLIRSWFPRHFFIYIYLNAFLAGGVSIVLSGIFASLLLSSTGVADFATLWDTYLVYFPLMFFPEAVLNGWFLTLLVGYRPHWVSTFRDEEYLHGK